MKSDLYGGSGKRENTNSNYLDEHYPKNMYPNKWKCVMFPLLGIIVLNIQIINFLFSIEENTKIASIDDLEHENTKITQHKKI